MKKILVLGCGLKRFPDAIHLDIKSSQMTNKEALRKNLFRIKELFDEINVTFCLVWGLALGAYREKDIIDWDNDVDVCVPVSDKFDNDLFLRIANTFRPCVEWLSYEYAIRDDPNSPRYGTSITFCFKDNSFPNSIEFCVIKGGIATHYCPKGYMCFPEHMFTHLNTINFLGKSFFIPSDTEKYLEQCYGKNWGIPKKEYNQDMRWNAKEW